MKLKTCIAILLVSTITIIRAQPGPPPREHPPQANSPERPQKSPPPPLKPTDPLEKNFFAPELIMQHQKAIGLTTDQQTAIRAEMQKMMAQFTDLQWQESAEAEAMAALASQDRPDEKAVLAQLDKMLSIENQIKRMHTSLLVRIKNLLTPEQQAQLRALQGKGPSPRPMADRNPQPARESEKPIRQAQLSENK